MGGSSREDVQSLVVLNPVTIVCCGIALLTMKLEHCKKYKYLLGIFSIILVVTFIYAFTSGYNFQNISLASGIMRDIYSIDNLSAISQPISLSPINSYNASIFLFAPLSVLLYSIQLSKDELLSTVPFIITIGLISGFVGILQSVGGPNSPLYLYNITNYGSTVGLFANRNHHAVLLALLFPILAFFAARVALDGTGHSVKLHLFAGTIAVILIPLILVAGSRSGLLAATVGLLGSIFIYKRRSILSDRFNAAKSLAVVLPVTLACMIFITIYFSRAEALDRLFYESAVDNNRGDFWQVSVKQFWAFYPFGFGPGTFVAVYQTDEPLFLLDGPHLNRLHNDWLETALTFGVLGLFIMFAGLACYGHRAFVLWVRMDGASSTVSLGRMASIVIGILGLASLTDYPLRTPAMAGLGTLAAVWFAHACQSARQIPLQDRF